MAITRIGGANAITGTIPTSVAPGKGKVLQVVQGSKSTQTNVSSTTFTDLGLSATITPSSTSNKILIDVNIAVRRGSGIQNSGAKMKLYKNGSELEQISSGFGFGQGSSEESTGNVGFRYLDTPSTTSSITYSIYGGSSGGNFIYYFIDNGFSTITLKEIEG